MSDSNEKRFVNDVESDEESEDTDPWRLETEILPLESTTYDFGNSIKSQVPVSLPKLPIAQLNNKKIYKTNGNFGMSYSGEFPNGGKEVFVKVYEAFGKRIEESIVVEIKCHWLGFKNENILKIYGIAPTITSIGLVIELMPGGSLETVIYDMEEKYEMTQLLSWILQFTLAITFLHSQKIIHRDIRPANMFLDAALKKLKLSDFGMATNLSQTTFPLNLHKRIPLDNRINYLAPELKKERKKEELIGKLPFKRRIMTKEGTIFEEESITNEEGAYKADVYSEGVTIWEVLKRKRPPASFDINKPDNLSTDELIAELLVRCLNLDPKERKITSEEISKWIGDLPKLRKEEEERRRHKLAMERINKAIADQELTSFTGKAKQLTLNNYKMEKQNEELRHQINMAQIARGGSTTGPSTSR